MDEEAVWAITRMDSSSVSICVVCNSNFVVPDSFQNLKQFLHQSEELKKLEECFAQNFGLSAKEMTQVSFSNEFGYLPFCSKCTPMAKEFLNLQTKLNEIQDKLCRVRLHIASVIVNNYVYTSEESPFFEMKSLIFEKWFDKIDEHSVGNEQGTLELHKAIVEETATPPQLSATKELNPERVSREVTNLTGKDKGDVCPNSIDEDEADGVTCGVCKKVCRSKINLISHMKSHTGGVRPFVCYLCKKSFFGSANYKKHLKARHDVHFDEQEETRIEKPVSAPALHHFTTEIAKVTMENGEEAQLIIGTRAETPPPQLEDQTLTSHEEFELSEYSYEGMEEPSQDTLSESISCDQCGRKFVSKVTLTKHVRTVHLKTIKVECPICKMTTRDHYNLSKHVLIHNPKLTKLIYNCPSCGEGFTIRKDCLAHFKNRHSTYLFLECPKPIVRAIEEHEPVNVDVNRGPEDQLLNDFEMHEVATPVSNEQTLISHVETGLSETTMETEECTGEAESNIELTSTSIESPYKGVEKPLQVKKSRKRRRRRFLTYSTKTKLYKQRMRLLWAKSHHIDFLEPSNSENEVAPNPELPTDPTLTIKLAIPPGSLTTEIDKILVQEAQRNHAHLQNLNFNIYVQTEKFQTVMLSPMRESDSDEDMDTFCSSVNELQEALDSLPESKEKESAMSENMNKGQRLNDKGSPRIKIYGPKSKLEEIRRKALLKANHEVKVTETENPKLPPTKETTVDATPESMVQNVKIKIEQPEPCKITNLTTVSMNQNFRTYIRPTLNDQMKHRLKMYVGPKSKIDAMKLKDLTAVKKAEAGIWKGASVSWSTPKAGKMVGFQSVQDNTGATSKWQSFSSKSLSQTKDQNRGDSYSSSSTPLISKDGKKIFFKAIVIKKPPDSERSSAPRAKNPNSTPQLQPAPTRFNSPHWEDPSKMLSTSSPESSSLSSFVINSLNREMNPWKHSSQNKELPQIPISIKKYKTPSKATPSVRVYPGKSKPIVITRQSNKSGMTKSNLLSFGVSLQHVPSGPVIESTRSLADPITPFRLVKTEVVDDTRESGLGVLLPEAGSESTAIGSCQPDDLMVAFQSTPEGQTAEVEALLKNSNIDVSIVNADRASTAIEGLVEPTSNTNTNEFKMIRLPSGITLVEVDNAFDRTTPKTKTDETGKLLEGKVIISKPNLTSNHAVTKPSLSKTSCHDDRVETEEVTYGELSTSASTAPIKIRNIASITEPYTSEMDDSELYQSTRFQTFPPIQPPPQKDLPLPQQTVGRNKSFVGVTEIILPPRPLIPRAPTFIAPRNRRFRQDELTPIIKYSEFQFIRQQQRSQATTTAQQLTQPQVVQQFGSPATVAVSQLTMNNNSVLIPLQTMSGNATFRIPTFIQVPTSTLTSVQLEGLMQNNRPPNNP